MCYVRPKTQNSLRSRSSIAVNEYDGWPRLRVFCMKGGTVIATSGQAKVAYDVTGGGNDDRPPVSLVRGPITVLSAELRVAAMSVERIIRRLLVY
jgi:hypothetical protein